MGNPADGALQIARERALQVALKDLRATLAEKFENADITRPFELQRISGLSPNVAAKVLRGDMKDPPLSTLIALMAALDLRSLEELLAPLGSTAVVSTWKEVVANEENA